MHRNRKRGPWPLHWSWVHFSRPATPRLCDLPMSLHLQAPLFSLRNRADYSSACGAVVGVTWGHRGKFSTGPGVSVCSGGGRRCDHCVIFLLKPWFLTTFASYLVGVHRPQFELMPVLARRCEVVTPPPGVSAKS